jgi:hypothetical protein
MRRGSCASTSMTPNWSASLIGCRIAATVAPAPVSMCCCTIELKSMRYTWSAPTTTTMSGRSSWTRFRLWKMASALPRYHRLPTRCCAGTGVT